MKSRPAAQPRVDTEAVRRWARLLDSQFRIPGTKLTFGLDPILGLIPGAGDLVGPVFGVVVLVHAWKMRVPKLIMARMVVNAGLDALFGIVPFLGDAIDLFWKANQANVLLLERHAYERRAISLGDRLFAGAAIAAVLLLISLPILLVVWIGRSLI